MKQFKTESKKLMDMMINSIYTNKEIFLRELISNASDANDKMYIKSLEDPNIEFDKDNFYIELDPNEEERTLTVRDRGIGMTAQELEENLGTIAHSDSYEFKAAEDSEDAASIIGQFGVGFYSAFMVADKVEVLSKAYGEDQAYLWTSSGSDGYTIEEAEKEDVGTSIKLYLREDEEDENYSQYLDEYRLSSLVKEHSNYIRYPIQMELTKTRKIEKDEGEDGEDQAPEYEEYQEVETLNSMTPIWNQRKSDLEDEDYINFYKQENFGYDEPLAWTHLVADGTISYRAILYIPSKPPLDFYTKDYKKGLALYSRGVKIMDHCEELLPDYYSFVKGVVSSDDLSLNISRETLQQDRQLIAISRKIESKITDELTKMLKNDPENYKTFFESFGTQLKAGIYQSYGAKKDTLADLLIFPTSKNNGMRTLEDVLNGYAYPDIEEDSEEKTEGAGDVEKTENENQEEKETLADQKIYYATGESVEKIDRMPQLQSLKKDGIEVLYFTEPIDEFAIKMMQDYKGHPFQSILSDDFSFDEDEEEAAEKNEEEVEFFDEMKEVLGEEVVDVKKSNRLGEDAVALIAQGEISIEMEKTFAQQPDGQWMKAQKVLAINPDHPLYEKLKELYKGNDKEDFEEYTKLLYNQARLIEGLPIENPVDFTRAVQNLMVD